MKFKICIEVDFDIHKIRVENSNLVKKLDAKCKAS